jgi:hypothetical protein
MEGIAAGKIIPLTRLQIPLRCGHITIPLYCENHFSQEESDMAHRIQVISILRPRVDQGSTVQKHELIRAISRATSIVEGVADLVIKEVRHYIVQFLLSGRAIKIEGLGTWTPIIGLDGTLDIQYRADPALIRELRTPGQFCGRISNPENIGLCGDELVAKWNKCHPEEPVVG